MPNLKNSDYEFLLFLKTVPSFPGIICILSYNLFFVDSW
jgi:hypothetical protein